MLLPPAVNEALRRKCKGSTQWEAAVVGGGSVLCVSMADTSLLFYYFSQRRRSASFRGFFFIPTSLALVTSLFILFYISSTSNLFTHQQQISLQLKQSPSGSSTISVPSHQITSVPRENGSVTQFEALRNDVDQGAESQRSSLPQLGSVGT